MEQKDRVYFLGIGGIGMSALARFYHAAGFDVYGYDLTQTPLTDELVKEGMHLHFDSNANNIPSEILDDRSSLIIYTPAMPNDHEGLNFLKENNYKILKRSKALGELAKNYKTIAVAGTHGKTTTSAFAAHILKNSKLNVISFVGGIMSGYEQNILIDKDPDWVLVEADEYDRSFLQLEPTLLGITSVDADHLDIYKDENDLLDSFELLGKKVENPKNVIKCDTIDSGILPQAVKYGFDENSSIQIIRKGYSNGAYDVKVKGLVKGNLDLSIPVPGDHNVLNAVLAASLCLKAGCDPTVIQESIASFKGVKRRFEFIVRSEKCTFIDDYAHHPKEIEALISAVKQLYPDKKITGIFQPHLFSRTLDFADDFAKSLSKLDQLYLLDIYPAREKPIEGVDSKMLLDKVELNEKSIVNKENIPILISSTIPEILLSIGAGDIAQLVPVVKQAVMENI